MKYFLIYVLIVLVISLGLNLIIGMVEEDDEFNWKRFEFFFKITALIIGLVAGVVFLVVSLN